MRVNDQAAVVGKKIFGKKLCDESASNFLANHFFFHRIQDSIAFRITVEAGKTPAGMHRPIMVDEVLAALDLSPGMVVADCTIGYGGHVGQDDPPRLSSASNFGQR